MNPAVASAAETAAAFITEHELPDFACVEIRPDRAADTVRTTFQISASTAELADLLVMAESLSGDVAATVLRRDQPLSFAHLRVDGDAAGVPVSAWTHPEGRELAALWDAIGYVPEYGTPVRVELDTLRAAAHAVSTSESAA